MHCDNKAAFRGSMFMHYMEWDFPNMHHKPLLLKLKQHLLKQYISKWGSESANSESAHGIQHSNPYDIPMRDVNALQYKKGK